MCEVGNRKSDVGSQKEESIVGNFPASYVILQTSFFRPSIYDKMSGLL